MGEVREYLGISSIRYQSRDANGNMGSAASFLDPNNPALQKT
jgi:hypothetical protein